MNLVANLTVHNERNRYLEQCIRSLTEFCDIVAVWDDGSDDGTYEYLTTFPKVEVWHEHKRSFFENEGATRQCALDWALSFEPTHVLAIDADEFVTNGHDLRALLEWDTEEFMWGLMMYEVWDADELRLSIRNDGEWGPHPMPAVWKVPTFMDEDWQIPQRKLACGRIPAVLNGYIHPGMTDIGLLHFGWTNYTQRHLRVQRYVEHDGGEFHNLRHLQSITWPDELIERYEIPWPKFLEDRKLKILERTVVDA